jgi:phosphomannomutase
MHADGLDADFVERVRRWTSQDPDPVTRDSLLTSLETGDEEELLAAFGATLTFGTAGIRGVVGPGPGRMNLATVIRTTAGLASHLVQDGRGHLPVVLGFDARPSSRPFAEATAGVLAAAGIQVVVFPDVIPTPIVAFAARTLGAGAAVVITASHNPPADNGYKVYAANAAQIIPPEDATIADAIEAALPANQVPMVADALRFEHDLISPVSTRIVDDYYSEVDGSRPAPCESDLVFVYTALHGVGGRYVAEIFERSGHRGLIAVKEQFGPDGAFPTVDFPNPEEPGSLDLAMSLARESGAAAVLANDPDADRLAAAVADSGDMRLLTGNEVGALLGDYVLRNWHHPETPIVASSIVSSPILARIAKLRGARHESTLTGFKWIADAALATEAEIGGRFAFGFEEALGYSVGRTVRDKDGISAALVFADLVAGEQRAGRTVVDRLHEIWAEVGLWVSTQLSVLRSGPDGPAELQRALAALVGDPPEEIAGYGITKVVDYRSGAEGRSPWLGAQALVEFSLGDRGRVLARPSGTEPKLKIYVDIVGEAGSNPDQRRAELVAEAGTLAAATRDLLHLG